MIFLNRKVNRAVTFQYQKGVDANGTCGRNKIWERSVSTSVAVLAATVVIQQCDQSVSITDWITALAALLSSAAPYWLAMRQTSKKSKRKNGNKKSR
jgi:hypothetical protein